MKKTILTFILIFAFLLNGCSEIDVSINNKGISFNSKKVSNFTGWYFSYNERTNDYSVNFELLNKKGESIYTDLNVDITIVNDGGEEVYKATKYVTLDCFKLYTKNDNKKVYIADIRIPRNDIKAGQTSSGKVYLRLYKEKEFASEEVYCVAYYCLPVADIDFKTEELPKVIPVKGYDGRIESKIRIDKVDYIYETKYAPTLKFIVSGEKIYEKHGSSGYDNFSYKIYDSEGYMVDSGTIFLCSLSKGDKFREESITVYDVKPGKTYILKFYEYTV